MVAGSGAPRPRVVDLEQHWPSSGGVQARPGNETESRMQHSGSVVTGHDASAQAGSAQVHPIQPSAWPQNNFLKELHREKRRSDRSLAPLSLVVFQINDETATNPPSVARLLELLEGAKRETDILGHVGTDLIAVLCPDTDEQGVNGFTRKIESQMAELPFVAICATYPDQLFDTIAKGIPTRPELAALIESASRIQSEGYALKRSLDIAGAIIALVLFAPIMLICAAMIAATSRGPIVYKHLRLGKGGKPFTFYKFRSMVSNVDDSVHREFVANLIKGKQLGEPTEDDRSAPYKLQNDSRITWVGRFIRKTSIDELPQLFNVLKGDMSLVGPRPPIPYEAMDYQPWHLRRLLTVKPGVTGLWQVAGRSSVSFNEMVRLDLRYIRDCSLMLDLNILIKTLVVVISCKGAG